MSSSFKAIFFDLDGTLVDSETLWVKSYHAYLSRKFHLTIDRALAEQRVYGKAFGDLYRVTLDAHPEVDAKLTEMEADMRSHFNELKAATDIRIPGSIDLLRRLALNHQVAIVSGSPRKDIALAIDSMKANNEVAFYLGAEDYTQGKPSPEPYRKAAIKMGFEAQDCLVFEDSFVGIASAKEAGMKCVAIAREDAPKQDTRRADLVLEDLREFNFNLLG